MTKQLAGVFTAANVQNRCKSWSPAAVATQQTTQPSVTQCVLLS